MRTPFKHFNTVVPYLNLMSHKKPKQDKFSRCCCLCCFDKFEGNLISLLPWQLSSLVSTWTSRTVAIKISSDQHNKIVAFIFVRLAELLGNSMRWQRALFMTKSLHKNFTRPVSNLNLRRWELFTATNETKYKFMRRKCIFYDTEMTRDVLWHRNVSKFVSSFSPLVVCCDIEAELGRKL